MSTLLVVRSVERERELGLFDALNLANCAANRAVLNAGSRDERFRREYFSALLWADIASDFNIRKRYS